ncbi:putative BSD domain-containing protein [Quillaja saponaria]|uniref:BSD domain-containing protein n=1 Tax=Quillaja saponaria TaxID=32244 RepID=A0AAD7LG47_QUISA|nr:putative BSD domain-containing protein [Quillaja saponaria]
MSWLFNSLQSDGDLESPLHHQPDTPEHNSRRPGTGVKEDLSVLGQTLGRQLLGVANFLAPPPYSSSTAGDFSDSWSPASPTIAGIRNDLVEIGGSFKTGLSLLSTNKAFSGVSKFASNLLQFQEPGEGAPGITDEVVDFVKEISVRPECWTDFPLPMDNDFSLSNTQKVHISTIEQLVPGFVALRLGLCSRMDVGKFWMIYFLLLLPRLNERDFDLLSTLKIVEARDLLLQKLLNKRNEEVKNAGNPGTLGITQDKEASQRGRRTIPSQETEIETEIVNATNGLGINDDGDNKDTEQSLEDTDTSTTSLTAQKKLEYDEDVSFSDLEDEESDHSDRLSGHRGSHDIRCSSPSGSSDWVQLNESSETRVGKQKSRHLKENSGDESSDWLTVDDFD